MKTEYHVKYTLTKEQIAKYVAVYAMTHSRIPSSKEDAETVVLEVMGGQHQKAGSLPTITEEPKWAGMHALCIAYVDQWVKEAEIAEAGHRPLAEKVTMKDKPKPVKQDTTSIASKVLASRTSARSEGSLTSDEADEVLARKRPPMG